MQVINVVYVFRKLLNHGQVLKTPRRKKRRRGGADAGVVSRLENGLSGLVLD